MPYVLFVFQLAAVAPSWLTPSPAHVLRSNNEVIQKRGKCSKDAGNRDTQLPTFRRNPPFKGPPTIDVRSGFTASAILIDHYGVPCHIARLHRVFETPVNERSATLAERYSCRDFARRDD